MNYESREKLRELLKIKSMENFQKSEKLVTFLGYLISLKLEYGTYLIGIC